LDVHQFALKLPQSYLLRVQRPSNRDSAVSNYEADVERGTELAGPVPASAGDEARPTRDFVATAATVGVIAAGVALFEVALIPGMVIGGAAVLAPKYLPKLGRRLRPLLDSTFRRAEPAASPPDRPDVEVPPAAPRFAIEQAVAKTITFRIIVTTLDFTTNYLVLGEFATAAGLSTFALVVGPLFYLAHETAWNYFGPPVEHKPGAWGTTVDLPVLPPLRPDAKAPATGWGGFTISRALAKTITFRTIATTMDFTANYVVVGDFATAVALSAFGFVLGPFVYLGHEMAWDYYGSPAARTPDTPTPTGLVLAPA
jgi:uncharacterized membrane protein